MPSTSFLEYMTIGFQAPSPRYYENVFKRQQENEKKLLRMIRMKAIVTLHDVLEAA